MNQGDKVIVRSSQSGVWFGVFESMEPLAANGNRVTITHARRLWRWWAAKGVSLSGVAVHGMKVSKLSEWRIEPAVSRVVVMDASEVLLVDNPSVAEQIYGAVVWER